MKDFTKANEIPGEEADELAAGSNPDAELTPRILKPKVRAVVVGLVLLMGIVLSTLLIVTRPKAEKKNPPRIIPRVSVVPFTTGSEQVVVQAMGTVIPSREIMLKARVSGEVLKVHPEFFPGGRVKQGEALLELDRSDYELAMAQAQSRLAQADFDYKLELGRQDVAKREWEVMGEPPDASETDRELALRKPHLKFARAALDAAKASLEQAELNLRRTSITAPFNAVVQQRMVDLGSQVSPQEGLATLVATDEYWVQVSIPEDRISWIAIPDTPGVEGATATVQYATGSREGRVIRLLSELEQAGRMARVLVSVKDPLGYESSAGLSETQRKRVGEDPGAQGRVKQLSARPTGPSGSENPGLLKRTRYTPLLLGSYVRVDIAGRQLDEVIKLPRTALRDNNRIWVMDGRNRLDIRTVSPVWRTDAYVLIHNGFKPEERLVVSGIPLPIQGMELQPDGMEPTETQKDDAS